MKAVIPVVGLLAVLMFPGCPVPENTVVNKPVEKVVILKNREEAGVSFDILEGRQVTLNAEIFPAVLAGVHWQDSRRRIVELSGFTGPEITVTGMNGGETIVSVLARNMLNEVPAESEVSIRVIPSSFFKWDFELDGLLWEELEPQTPGFMGKVKEILVRSGERTVTKAEGGFILEGPGASLAVGSVMETPTNSSFSDDPLFDPGGAFDFVIGPSADYPFYRFGKQARISVDYQVLEPSGAGNGLRIQVNNNTGERISASAIDNWLVKELGPDDIGGTVSAVFDAAASKAAKSGVNVNEVLSSSFVFLYLPEGKILISGIRIESVD